MALFGRQVAAAAAPAAPKPPPPPPTLAWPGGVVGRLVDLGVGTVGINCLCVHLMALLAGSEANANLLRIALLLMLGIDIVSYVYQDKCPHESGAERPPHCVDADGMFETFKKLATGQSVGPAALVAAARLLGAEIEYAVADPGSSSTAPTYFTIKPEPLHTMLPPGPATTRDRLSAMTRKLFMHFNGLNRWTGYAPLQAVGGAGSDAAGPPEVAPAPFATVTIKEFLEPVVQMLAAVFKVNADERCGNVIREVITDTRNKMSGLVLDIFTEAVWRPAAPKRPAPPPPRASNSAAGSGKIDKSHPVIAQTLRTTLSIPSEIPLGKTVFDNVANMRTLLVARRERHARAAAGGAGAGAAAAAAERKPSKPLKPIPDPLPCTFRSDAVGKAHYDLTGLLLCALDGCTEGVLAGKLDVILKHVEWHIKMGLLQARSFIDTSLATAAEQSSEAKRARTSASRTRKNGIARLLAIMLFQLGLAANQIEGMRPLLPLFQATAYIPKRSTITRKDRGIMAEYARLLVAELTKVVAGKDLIIYVDGSDTKFADDSKVVHVMADSPWFTHPILLAVVLEDGTVSMDSEWYCKLITDVAATFKIKQWQIVGACTDNTATMPKAVRLAGLRHIPCMAHIINLMVTCIITAFGLEDLYGWRLFVAHSALRVALMLVAGLDPRVCMSELMGSAVPPATPRRALPCHH